MPNLLLNNSPLEQIITDTVDGVKQYIEAKEQNEAYDEDYHSARKFMTEYRHCLLYGDATETFLEDFKQYTLALFKTKKIQKANTFLYTTLGGLALSFIGMYVQSEIVITAGTFACAYALSSGFIIAREIKAELRELKKAIDNSEQINTTLQSLYKQGK